MSLNILYDQWIRQGLNIDWKPQAIKYLRIFYLMELKSTTKLNKEVMWNTVKKKLLGGLCHIVHCVVEKAESHKRDIGTKPDILYALNILLFTVWEKFFKKLVGWLTKTLWHYRKPKIWDENASVSQTLRWSKFSRVRKILVFCEAKERMPCKWISAHLDSLWKCTNILFHLFLLTRVKSKGLHAVLKAMAK